MYTNLLITALGALVWQWAATRYQKMSIALQYWLYCSYSRAFQKEEFSVDWDQAAS